MGLLSSLFGMGGASKEAIQDKIKSGAVIIDVRTPGEFNSGHAKGSKNIPLNQLSSKMNALKGKEVIVVCKSGGRAMQAESMLKQAGIDAINAGPWQAVS